MTPFAQNHTYMIMSKTSDNILKIKEYMSFELGNECEFTPIESRCVTMLPLTMREIYELYATNIIGKMS